MPHRRQGRAGGWVWAPAFLTLLLLSPLAAAQQGTSDAEVLLQFAAAARGDNARALADWREGTQPCRWSGVTCSAGGAVTTIKLPRAGLAGQLYPDLAQLSSLQHIDLTGNALGGTLPARWARLPALERLHLDGNALTGTLPPAWNVLEGIQYLSLRGNRLNGTLPAAWSSMGRLYLLDLSGNSLGGTLPAPWSRQRWLSRLALAGNRLGGPLPKEWGRLAGLLQLDLGGNTLSGGLPPEWGNLRQATSLDLSHNQLAGPLPPAWGRLGSLQMLALQGNQLSGVVPTQWEPLTDRAYRISLGDNPALCGAVPQPLVPAVLAAGTSSKGSGLAASCPWEADAAALLAFKAAVAAAPGGALADWLPEANPCSDEAWAGVSCRGGRVVILNLANAGLQLSSLQPLGGLTALQKVLLAGNSAPNATLPEAWAALGQLSAADLTGTGVAGTLPAKWAEMGSMKQLLLGGNRLNGTLPASWGALSQLATLNLAQNALTGGLPPEWGELASLTSLDASSNYLSGGLPEAWKDLTSLQEAQLANNNLGGTIPRSWARLPSLALLNLGSNVGVCGGQPAWRAGTQVRVDATNVDQSCIMVNTSGAVAGTVLGVSLSATIASLAAAAAMLVYVRRQREQLTLLQRERSAASFSLHGGGDAFGGGKLASLHTFSVAVSAGGAGMQHDEGGVGSKKRADHVKALAIPDPWSESQHGGYIQVPIATPGSALPAGLARTPPRAGSAPLEDEHRSPSPTSGIPSPERRQWQVAAQAADRGVDLTARRSRQKRLFRSRSEAPAMLGGAARGAPQPGQDSREGDQEEEGDLEMLRVHSRMALWPQGGSGDGSIV